MKMVSFSVLLGVLMCVCTTYALVCMPDQCKSMNCDNTLKCGLGETLIPNGGQCGCCHLCVKILKEGDTCSFFTSIMVGNQPPTIRCADGLMCSEQNICVPFQLKSTSTSPHVKSARSQNQ